MERSITGIRQKEKEKQNTSTGDLGVHRTGMVVVRSRVKDTKASRGSDLGSQGCVMALVLQRGAIPRARPEAGLTLLLDEEVQTSVMCRAGDLSCSTIYRGLLWLPAHSLWAGVQESAPFWVKGSGRALKTLPQVTGIDTKTNGTKWHQDFFRAGNGQVVQPEVQVFVFLGPLGQQWASPKTVCQESRVLGFYKFAFFYCARFHAKVGINVVM